MNIFVKGFMLAGSILVVAAFAIALFKADRARKKKARIQRRLAMAVARQRKLDSQRGLGNETY